MTKRTAASQSAESQLLEAILRIDGARDAAIAAVLERPIDWQRLQRQARFHGVLPLVYTGLAPLEVARVASDAMQAMRAFYVLNAQRTLRMVGDLVRVVRALETAGIPVLVLKGVALAALAYGDPASRYFSDLDILVRDADVRRAGVILGELGLQSLLTPANPTSAISEQQLSEGREQQFLFPNRKDWLELHWRLTDPDLQRELTAADCFGRSQTVCVDGQPLQTLGPDDLALYLCLHGTAHRWEKYRHLADFARTLALVASARWSVLLAMAREQGLRNAMLLGMRLAHDVLGLPLPEDIARMANRQRGLPTLARWIRRRLAQGDETEPDMVDHVAFVYAYTSFVMTEGRWAGIRRVMDETFPVTAADRQWVQLPEKLHWLYPALRPIRLAGKVVRVLKKRP